MRAKEQNAKEINFCLATRCGQRGAFVGLGNSEPGTSADVFGLEQRGAVGDGDFRPSDGGGYVAYKQEGGSEELLGPALIMLTKLLL